MHAWSMSRIHAFARDAGRFSATVQCGFWATHGDVPGPCLSSRASECYGKVENYGNSQVDYVRWYSNGKAGFIPGEYYTYVST